MDWLTRRLHAYGIDGRARSALRACAGILAANPDPACSPAALVAALDLGDADDSLRESAVRFVQLFQALPAEDFAPEWLTRLSGAWLDLHHRGARPDFPLRTANALHACATATLLGDRDALASLQLEISMALAAAAACVAGMLLEYAAQADVAQAAEAGEHDSHRRLARQLESEIERAGAAPVGLLSVRFMPGAAALTWDADQRETLCRSVLARAREALRDCDILLRTENHAFAVILPQVQMGAQVVMAANKLVQSMEAPLPFEQQSIRLPLHVGVAWTPDHGDDAAALIRGADLAGHEARRLGRPMLIFEAALQAQAHEESRLEQELVAAMDNGRLDIHVQPQIDLQSGRVCGGEALLRWTDSAGEMVPPYRAPEIAERLGLGPQLRHWLIHRGCRLLAELNTAGTSFNLSINLTATDLRDPELPLMVGQALRLWQAPAARLTFELTESVMIEDPPEAARLMSQLRDLGIATAIDDFGTGYSSVSYLRQLPLNELKIDHSFVATALKSTQDRNIVESLIKLAHALDLEVVAEGVEDAATLTLLRQLGCNRAQGYWISRAMPPQALPEWICAWDAGATARG